jgi:hypothetical protein
MTGGPAACQPAHSTSLRTGLNSGPESGKGCRMSEKDKEREERLAAALRENLKRRKAQAREQDARTEEDKPRSS